MKFLFIAPRFHTNQIEVVRTLTKKKNKVFFNSIYKGKIEDYSILTPFILKQNFISKFLDFFFKTDNKHIFYFPNIFSCFQRYKKINPDVAIIRLYGRLNTYLSAIILKLLNTKILFYEQAPNDFSHLNDKRIKKVFKLIELKLQNFFFKSKWVTPLRKNKFLYKNSFYLPFVVKIRKIIRRKKIFRILIIGKYQERKCIYLALKSLKKLSNLHKFKVTIIGEVSNKEQKEYYNRCKKFIKSNDLGKKIKMLSNIKYNKIHNFYRSHHLFLLPSVNEPASISLLEAIGNSMPVICSDTCGTKYYVKKSFGKIFKSNNISSLNRSIEYYLKNKKKYLSYSKNAYKFACKNLSESNYYNFLRKIC
tara:strand:+ start:59 stop:1147 length:1089 start_codon:yes stop_codon:yes gene_type:complete